MKVLNLKTEKAQDYLEENFRLLEGEEKNEFIRYCRTLDRPFLFKYGSDELFFLEIACEGSEAFVKKNNLLFFRGYYPPYAHTGWDDDTFKVKKNTPPSAAFVFCPVRTEKNKDFQVLMLLNADSDDATYPPDHNLVSEFEGEQFPAVSWSALTHFYDSIKQVNSRIDTGKLKLKDFTPDERIAFTKEEKELLRNNSNVKPPGLGFTAIGIGNLGMGDGYWHRPGYCLFHDREKKLYLLTGQDEGSYFVAELPKRARTVAEALEVLTPDEARVEGTKRQGEWFVVPCSEEEVPALHETVLLFETDESGCAYLPLDHVESNQHNLWTSDGRVGKDGYLYAFKPILSHRQHGDLRCLRKGWYYFVKNTALRSYSEGGVD